MYLIITYMYYTTHHAMHFYSKQYGMIMNGRSCFTSTPYLVNPLFKVWVLFPTRGSTTNLSTSYEKKVLISTPAKFISEISSHSITRKDENLSHTQPEDP